MPLWQRLIITLIAMIAASFIAGLIWSSIFTAQIPSYLSGLIGGVTAVPVWEFLKRVQPRRASHL